MDITEYNKLKQQVEDRYKNTISSAQRERSEGLKAIETVWNMLKNNVAETQQKVNEKSIVRARVSSPDNKYGAFVWRVKTALHQMPEIFTKRDINKVLGGSLNDNTLTGCLARLERKGIIKLIERGKGRAPSKYKKNPDLGLKIS